MEPVFAGWEERCRASFARQGLMATLGARIASLSPGRCLLEVDADSRLTQQHGFMHAGVTIALADSAGGYAGYTLFAASTEVLTAELKVNLLAPAVGARIRAEGVVLRYGRRLTVCEVKVYAIDGERERLCAAMLQTLASVPSPEGTGLDA